jgi:hypothetical protein
VLGYELPAPSTARNWLEQFHDEEAVAQRPFQGSFIPQESPGLSGLREVNRRCVWAYTRAVQTPRQVTLDVDAHLVGSSKRGARMTYEGFRGYQPLIVTWAETGMILADEFRDGNVPASIGIARLVNEAYESLPTSAEGWEVRIRSDSAAYEQAVLDDWHGRGWKFAVSADMSPQLRQAVEQLGPGDWHMWKVESDGFVRDWAEVAFVPSRKTEKRDLEPYRYLVIRIRPPQGMLFSDGNRVKTFAVVTNDLEMSGQELLEWHRGKAGSVEQSHRILKDELAAGVYPSGKFGANAAWLRLQVLTHNTLILMKATALDEAYRQAHPKRLRFAIFNHVGRVIQHARLTLMRVVDRLLDTIIGPGLARLRIAPWSAA